MTAEGDLHSFGKIVYNDATVTTSVRGRLDDVRTCPLEGEGCHSLWGAAEIVCGVLAGD